MKFINKRNLIIYGIVVLLLYLVIYAVPSITGLLKSTYTLQYGQLKVYDEAVAYVVRSESVYLASMGGQINPLIEENSVVRKDTTILEISGSAGAEKNSFSDITKKLKKSGITVVGEVSQKPGIVSFSIDGEEGLLTPSTMEDKKKSYFEKLDNIKTQSLKREKTAEDEPIFKIVDQGDWYLVTYIDKAHKDRYEEGSSVSIELSKNKKSYSIDGIVQSSKGEGSYQKVIIRVFDYYEGMTSDRTIKINLVESDMSGLVVLNKSIVNIKGQEGLYVKNKIGKFKFVPIKVISTDGENSIVAKNFYYDEDGQMVNTVKAYDIVEKSP